MMALETPELLKHAEEEVKCLLMKLCAPETLSAA
jgi:hypothetical protein